MSSTEIQEIFFSAIDTLIDHKVDELLLDKTITASIIACTNALEGEYKLSYNGGYITAYTKDKSDTYGTNNAVYVLVPENDFSKKKIILGLATKNSDNTTINFISSALNDYNTIGRNVITDKNNIYPAGLHSYYKFDSKVLYQYGSNDNELLDLNIDEFNNYISEAEALLVEADFQTRLPKEHKLSKTGNYGIIFKLAFQELNDTASKYDTYLPKRLEVENFETILNLRETLEKLWKDDKISPTEKAAKSKAIMDALEKYMTGTSDNLTSEQLETIQSFIDLYLNISEKNNNLEAVKESYLKALKKLDEVQEPTIKYLDYVIDTNDMTGNPYLFNTYSNQYGIFNIDTKNFLYVQSITIFSEGFELETDLNKDATWGADIFCKNIEIYGLKKISSTNGGYKLSVSTPRGSTFRSILSSDVINAVARVTYQNAQDLTDSCTYQWFIEDGRIDASSEYYSANAGGGWRRLKDKGTGHSIEISAADNRAASNRYKCVAIYNESVIMKFEFVIYNDSAKRDIEIKSDLGTKFSFDRGKPVLTCYINGKNRDFDPNHDDSLFRFIWSKVNLGGKETVFNTTIEQYEQQLEELDKQSGNYYGSRISIQNKIEELQDVEFTQWTNTFSYPVVKIDTLATFRCSVYMKDNKDSEEYFVGSADITLQNEVEAEPATYHIEIENGDQVFQYSESGVSPDSDRYTNPLEILNLECHFFDENNIEVNKEKYSLTWVVPLENTMIVLPNENMVVNPASNKYEWCKSEIYPLQIEKNYNYSALNNQITCVVEYEGEKYTKDTRFYFGKIGDNGTNGTDVVAKIYPTSNAEILDREMLTLELRNGIPQRWNSGQKIGDSVLDFSIYRRNEDIINSNMRINWTVKTPGFYNSYMNASSSGFSTCTIGWNQSIEKPMRVQIVQANTKIEGQQYYAYYNIPVIDYKNSSYHIGIDFAKTLKDIMYNADGRDPQYNENQGVTLHIDDSNKKYIVWKAEGGIEGTSPNFKLISKTNFTNTRTKNEREKYANELIEPHEIVERKPILDEDGNLTGKYEDVYTGELDNLESIYIIPNDTYSGEYTNNIIHGYIYTDKSAYEQRRNTEAEVYIPLNMFLNVYGLASLNAWDGNHIDINEDGNYILAPQIGAGIKHDDNTFTGIVMGQEQRYDEDNDKVTDIGLLGYSHGKQSIFLDAETGNATFGLPEVQADGNNNYEEGRIELRPGGTSKIGNWKIGSRVLYNALNPETGEPVDLDKAYTDFPRTDNYTTSIGHQDSGILLSSTPSYISIKGRPLSVFNSSEHPNEEFNKNIWDINNEDGNSLLENGDCFELELNPNTRKIFTIYRHYPNSRGVWTRDAMVGIDEQGRFYTQSLKESGSSLNLNSVPAFGKTVGDDKPYKGVNVEVGPNNESTRPFFKAFVDYEDAAKNSQSGTLYISGGSSTTNEYTRPLKMYGKDITFYASSSSSTEKFTDHRISISSSLAEIGHFTSYIDSKTGKLVDTGTYINLSSKVNKGIDIFTTENLNITSDKTTILTENIEETVQNKRNITVEELNTETYKKGSTVNITGSLIKSCTKSFSLTNNNSSAISKISLGTDGFYFGGTDNDTSYLELKKSGTIKSTLNANTGIDIKGSSNSYLTIERNLVKLQSTSSTNELTGLSLTFTPSDIGSSSKWYLGGPQGSIESTDNAINYQSGVKIHPGFSTKWGYFTDSVEVTGEWLSIYANNTIYTNQNVKGSDFKFLKDESFPSQLQPNGLRKQYTYSSLYTHLDQLYLLLDNHHVHIQNLINNNYIPKSDIKHIDKISTVIGMTDTVVIAQKLHELIDAFNALAN